MLKIDIEKELIPIYKPKGWPSFKIVKLLRKITGIKKIGYIGTLDPKAEGLLVVGIGKGTKKLKNLPQDKTYLAEIAFGLDSDTWDLESKKIKLVSIPRLNKKIIKKALENFVGKIEQIIPLYSAKKIRGQRLYKLARAGKVIKKLPKKKVIIFKIKLLDFKKKKINLLEKKVILPIIKIEVNCSGGTFIRSLAYELGQKLKTKAVLIKLIRTKEAGFSVKEALKIEYKE